MFILHSSVSGCSALESSGSGIQRAGLRAVTNKVRNDDAALASGASGDTPVVYAERQLSSVGRVLCCDEKGREH